MSPASQSYRDALYQETSDSDPDYHPLPPADPESSSELPINPSLVAAFLESLMSLDLHLHFTYGSWRTFSPGLHFDVILTSETIYRKENLSSLLDVMWKAYSTPSRSVGPLDELATTQLTLSEPVLPACYVAGKTLYFGVGGGISDFVDAVENPQMSTSCSREKGQVETIREHVRGVSRKVLRVRWSHV
jgi:protein-histidine N-methyltransferase